MKEYPYKERLLAGIIDSLLLSMINSIYMLPASFFAVIPLILKLIQQSDLDPNLVDAEGYITSLLWLVMWLVIIMLLSVAIGLYWYVFRPAKHDGQTFGKSFMKIKVVKVDSSTLTATNLLVRYIAQVFLAQAISIFVYITIFIDDENRAVYDFVSNTKVVRS
jgi:uncharacterized RDD family membrane protein YckC